MSNEEGWDPTREATVGRSTNDVLFKVLSNPNRRYFLYELLDGGELSTGGLEAETLAWARRAGPIDEADPDQILLKMYHVHVPLMEKAGLLTYDPATETFVLADLPDRVRSMIVLARENELRER